MHMIALVRPPQRKRTSERAAERNTITANAGISWQRQQCLCGGQDSSAPPMPGAIWNIAGFSMPGTLFFRKFRRMVTSERRPCAALIYGPGRLAEAGRISGASAPGTKKKDSWRSLPGGPAAKRGIWAFDRIRLSHNRGNAGEGLCENRLRVIGTAAIAG